MLQAMPDLDRLPTRAARGWNNAAKSLRGHHEPEIVAGTVEKAIAASIRGLAHDYPGVFEDLGHVVAALCSEPSARETALREALARLPHPSTCDMIWPFVETAELHVRGVGRTEHEDAESTQVAFLARALERMANAYCFRFRTSDLIPEPFGSREQLNMYIDQCNNRTRYEKLAADLVSRRTPESIRAPRRGRTGTRQLLHRAL